MTDASGIPDGESPTSSDSWACELLEQLPVAIALVRARDDVIAQLNSAFEGFLGRSRATLIGHALGAENEPATLRALAPLLHRARAGTAAARTETDIEVSLTTRTMHLRVSVASLVWDAEPHFLLTLTDISTDRATQSALRDTQGRFRTLVEFSQEAICIHREGRFIYVNPAAMRLFGAEDPSELIGRSILDTVHPSFHEIVRARVDSQSIALTHAPRIEERLQKLDGTPMDVEVQSARIIDEGRAAVFTSMRDISEQKRHAARFRRLADADAQGVFFWDVSGQVLGANDAFLNLVGYTRTELADGLITLHGLMPSGSESRVQETLRDLTAGRVMKPTTTKFIRKDRKPVYALVGAAAYEDDPDQGVAYVLDLTERRLLERQLLRAQRLESIGTLAGGIAHDLNNVLAPILLSVDLLRDDITDPEALRQLDQMQSSVKRGAEMVQQVLQFARGVEGRRVNVNPRHVLGEFQRVARDTFPKSIAIECVAANGLWSVIGDPTQLYQVLLNLCVNARDAMPDGGTLSVRMENLVVDAAYAAIHPDARVGEYVLVKVADSGIGIPAAHLDRLFDPFFTTKGIGQGTGLGLSTTRAIIKSHEGFIHVYSELGHGTTFSVYLPATPIEGAPDDAPIRDRPMPQGSGQLVLVVDDEAPIREVVRGILERNGYRIMLAADGASAVALFAEHRRDVALVLTDIAMPIMDGTATMIVLRAIDPTVKVIGSSGLTSNDGVAKALGAGMEHFLAKPYTAETLLRTVDRAIRGTGGSSATAAGTPMPNADGPRVPMV